ncbi:membrane-located cell surface saccharide acetylase [Stappia sp. 22II-S9-Z10]|nr:membrane-located cell surface saccharide acetylase [Stappia sp. 22II-S9-Z10]
MDQAAPVFAKVDQEADRYRPDIDGLRAIAVVSVFLFHLGTGWLPGGFVGVDVFFVISGYLITGILLADLEARRFSFARFYQRRIARLFPVMITVILATILAASLVYSPQDFASAGVNSVASLLSAANIKYLFQGSYFSISPDAQPFLHFWSLSVEEQFYLGFPALLWVLFRIVPRHLAMVVAGLSLVSFVACVTLTFMWPQGAFYLLPTRAWELGAGALVAIAGLRILAAVPAALRPLLAPAGIGAILFACFLFHEGMRFPGYAAALPVIGAVAILLATQGPRYPGYALLASRPFVAVGLVSYALYLWHWPVFSITDYALFASPDWLRLAIKVGLSVGLTVVTFFVLERPSRRYLNAPSRRWATIGSFVLVAALWTPAGLAIRSDYYVNASIADVAAGGLLYEGEPGKPSIVLIGDSNGSMYGRTLRQTCADLGCTLRVASSAAGDALPRTDGPSSELWRDSLALVERVRPDVVVMADLWSVKLDPDRGKLPAALDALRPLVGRIVLLNQPPRLPDDATRAAIRAGARPPFREDPENAAARAAANAYLETFAGDDIEVVDITSAFTAEDGSVIVVDEAGRQLYHDATHLSGHGAARIRSRIRSALLE